MPLTDHFKKAAAERAILAVFLPAIAGAVNATGFLTIGAFTSHVTGTVARTGVEWAQHHQQGMTSLVQYVAIFIAGAMTAAAMLEAADRLHRVRFVAPLLTEAAALAAFAWLAPNAVHTAEQVRLLTFLLLFAMGLQNALVTRLSRAEVRTTHVTGTVTDIGIELVRAALWLKDHLREGPIDGLRGWLRLVGRDPEFRKLRLHVVILASFLSGAFIGPVLSIRYGPTALMAPAFAIVLLIAYDLIFGIPHRLVELKPSVSVQK